MHNIVDNERLGRTTNSADEHLQDHKKWRRRDFLQSTGLFTAGLAAMMDGLPIYALGTPALHSPLSMVQNDRTLVLIQLRGGNDGVNTVIDRFNSEYYRIRPNIAVTENNLWGLTDKIGMPNSMLALQPMWEEESMKIIQNVGYPEPNYSHFRSSDIWATASDSEEVKSSGWIGRFIDQDMPAFLDAQPTIPPALQIGVQTDLIFQGPRVNLALALSSPQEFYNLAISGNLYDINNLTNSPRDQELFYVRQVANSAFRYSQSISEAYNKGRNEANYPNNYLAQQLSIVAKLIKGRLGTKVYMVYIDGFDTHADQYDAHLSLLQDIATSVSAFYSDLNKANMSENVLGLTFSEFGRTIYENGSLGTDHGTGGPMLMFGGGIGKGIIGSPPDLLNGNYYGDPSHEIDFKDVYSSVLENWFGLAPEVSDFVLGKDRTPINDLLPPLEPTVGTDDFGALLGHRTDEKDAKTLYIQYAMLHEGPAILEILDKSGQSIRTIFNDYRPKGSHTQIINTRKMALTPGQYVYRLKTGGKVYQRKMFIN